MSHFTAEFFKNNRANLVATFADKKMPVIVAANGLLQRGGDSSYKFHQDADFWYLTGLDDPDVVLFCYGSKEYLILPDHGESHKAFNGAINDKEAADQSGVENVLSSQDGWKLIARVLNKTKKVASLAPPEPFSEKHGLFTNPARAALIKKIRMQVPGLKLVNVSKNIINLRMIKQEPELKAIQQAIDITIASMRDALIRRRLTKYTHEYEIEAELAKQFRIRGAQSIAFESIVAGGPRAVTLHYIQNNHRINKKELMVVDVGAEVEHYAADITRTISFSTPTKRQKQVYDAVKRVQDYAKSLIKPGIMQRDYEIDVAEYMGQELQTLGLVKEANLQETHKYFPHNTSHFLGLNVHDEGDYTQPFKAGMVITVEPGIYIPEEGIGVRLEDDVLITEDGCKVLSEQLPGLLQ